MGVVFNKKRTIRQYLRHIKWYSGQKFFSIPYRLTSFWRKMPEFIIIGVRKGGTTSLFEFLNQHPDVQLARENEIDYFSSRYYRSKLFYRSYFPLKKNKKMTGERSTYYFIHPHAPARIKKDLPKAKIILLLRDPVLRAHSQYQMNKGIDTAADFDEAVQLEHKRIHSIQEKILNKKHCINLPNQVYSYVSSSLYYKHLSNWLNHFNLNEMLIIKSEDFFKNTKEKLKDVYDFLGLKEFYPKDLNPKNKRNYADLTENEYLKYKKLFKEDSEQLKGILGDHFTW